LYTAYDFANIVAAADDRKYFTELRAESGGVPVSASSPSLLVSTIEVQKKQKSQQNRQYSNHL